MNKNKSKILALKYRPSTFKELIGQEVISETISNAIKMNKTPNAYLLTGIRGVGKTTTARLIAKALNCFKNFEKDEKCGEKETCHCREIENSNHIDVLEMDAASKTGIDDVRELIENSKYNPTSAEYKIFIIDEVHMLSKQAFNGLLKTLEEPPAKLKFILATTEPRKIPITVLSRCQRFDLKRVSLNILSNHLKKICKIENGKITEEALGIIARAADGSVRDGLSILDQSIAFSGKHISEEQVKEMIGLNDPTKILELIKFITAGQTQQSLEKINELYDNGADPSMIVKDLIETVHSLTMINIDSAEGVKSSLTDSEYSAVQEVAGNLDVSTLSMIWQMLNKGLHEVTDSFSPITSLETLIIRIIYLNDIPKPNELISELNNMVEKNDNKIQDKSGETSSEMDPKVKEIIDFFPGTEVEQIEEK